MAEFDQSRYSHLTEPQLQFMGIVAANEGLRRFREGAEFLAEEAEFSLNLGHADISDDMVAVDFRFLGYSISKISLTPYDPEHRDATPWIVGPGDHADNHFIRDEEAEGFIVRLKKAHDLGIFVPA